MELYHSSLSELKKKTEYISESQIRQILKDISTGLRHLHSKKIVHLDICPGNKL